MEPDPGATPFLSYLRRRANMGCFRLCISLSPHVQAVHIPHCPLILIPLPQMETAVAFEYPRTEIYVTIIGLETLFFATPRG